MYSIWQISQKKTAGCIQYSLSPPIQAHVQANRRQRHRKALIPMTEARVPSHLHPQVALVIGAGEATATQRTQQEPLCFFYAGPKVAHWSPTTILFLSFFFFFF